MRASSAAFILGIALALVAAFPVAANATPRTGDRINLFDPPATMAADQPFWVGHGWCSTLEDEDPLLPIVNPSTRVELAVDGTPITTATDVTLGVAFPDPEACVALKINYHNFRGGLAAGEHTLSGCWYLLGELQFCNEATVTFA